jgi:nucleoside-diphosphate-sugar epimerase
LGASGFIGRWVARTLAERGAHVIHAVRDRRAFERIFLAWDLAGDVVQVELTEAGNARRLLHSLRPAITFNLAGYGVDRTERDEATAYQLNARLVEELARATAEVRDRQWPGLDLVHAGSALEYGELDGDLREESVPNPTTVYGRSKLEGTEVLARVAAERGIKAVTARLFTVYGPGEHPGRLLPTLFDAARTGEPARLTTGTQARDFTYVADAAEGLCRLGLAGARSAEVVNLATGRLTAVKEFAETAAGVLNIPRHKLQFGRIAPKPEEMEHAGVRIDRLRGLISWSPSIGIGDGIRKTVEFTEKLETRGWTLCNSNSSNWAERSSSRLRSITRSTGSS